MPEMCVAAHVNQKLFERKPTISFFTRRKVIVKKTKILKYESIENSAF